MGLSSNGRTTGYTTEVCGFDSCKAHQLKQGELKWHFWIYRHSNAITRFTLVVLFSLLIRQWGRSDDNTYHLLRPRAMWYPSTRSNAARHWCSGTRPTSAEKVISAGARGVLCSTLKSSDCLRVVAVGEVMDTPDLKTALVKKIPVEYRGVWYRYISGVIYRMINDKFCMQVELMDQNRNSVIIANPSEVFVKNLEDCE